MEPQRQYFSDKEIVADPEFRGMFSASTLQKLRIKGDGPRYLKVGNKVFYRREWMREWIEAKVVTSTTEAA
jgi:hypothetical protein